MSESARILVIDDDPNLRKTLGDVLAFKGYVPMLADKGRIALELVAEEEIAVALVDLRLGDMAGLDVVRAIREYSSETEFILLTGHASTDSAIDAVNLGAYSYFQKPFDLERLLLSIRHAVERREVKRALAESEARYHTFLNATVDSAFLKDDQFRYLLVNDANADWFGKPSAEIIGKDDFELTDAEVARLARVSDQKVLDSNAPATIVETVRDRVYETSKFPVQLRDGRVGVGGYSRDITERKLAEERLILLSTALDAAANAIIITDRDGTVEWVNQAASALTGYSAEETIGKNPRDLIKSGLHDQEFYKSLWSTILAGQVWHGQFTNRRKDGTLYPEDATITPLRDAEGKIQRFIAVKQDITERVRAEKERERLLAELQEQAWRIQGIVDTVPEGVILVDESGRLMLANPIAESDLAVLTEQPLDAPFNQDHALTLTHLGGRPLRELLEAPPQGGWHELEAAGRTFEVIARAMPDGPGGRSWLLVLSDVTRSRQLQRVQGAQERLAAVGQLAAGIAHDFNNIMGVITIYCDLLAKTADLTPKQQHHLGTIRAQADLAANLIHQILDFSRRAPMTRAPLDLLGLVREHVRLLERTVPANILLQIEADRNDYIVLADPARLQPALMNLALNASDAMPDGGKLVFSFAQLRVSPGQNPLLPVSEEADWVRLDVSDTGLGIPPQHLTRIFEPFFTTKGPGKGTGLGLAQVYGIVQQHDGAIEVHSQVGTGTLFSIYLPLFSFTIPEPEALPDVPPVFRGGGTILLAEDNQATREGMTEVLEGHGYRVLPVGTGTAALRLLSEMGEAIDLVLCDLVMPEMGGVELYHRIMEGYPNVKVLFMTGYALDVGEHRELMRDGVAWLQKPFSASALSAKLRDLMEGLHVG